MHRSIATALAAGIAILAAATAPHRASAQGMGAPQCNDFLKLKDDAEKKAHVVQAASKSHDRKEMCTAVSHFVVAEAAVVKFLTDNQTWCGVPAEAVTSSKANHEKTIKFRDTVCAEAPKPKIPTLSDAIGTPTLDTAKNTKTGPGTFDTLTGNPLAK
jgi:hypothetical protein